MDCLGEMSLFSSNVLSKETCVSIIFLGFRIKHQAHSKFHLSQSLYRYAGQLSKIATCGQLSNVFSILINNIS